MKEARPFLKDIYLIPSQQLSRVPRGRTRSNLSENGFVSFSIVFSADMSEEEVRDVILTEFRAKFQAIEGDSKFQFLKAVNDSLIELPNKVWDAKFLKHMTGNGPLYIRAAKSIPVHATFRESETLDGDDDDDAIILQSPTSPALNITSQQTLSECSPQLQETQSLDTVDCPICCKSIPKSVIEVHASICENWSKDPAADQYADLMYAFDDNELSDDVEFSTVLSTKTSDKVDTGITSMQEMEPAVHKHCQRYVEEHYLKQHCKTRI